MDDAITYRFDCKTLKEQLEDFVMIHGPDHLFKPEDEKFNDLITFLNEELKV